MGIALGQLTLEMTNVVLDPESKLVDLPWLRGLSSYGITALPRDQ